MMTEESVERNGPGDPIWKIPIPVIIVSGEYRSGKTIFALTIDPGPKTLVYDLEKSSLSYHAGFGFDRIDVPDEMLKWARSKGKKSYTPAELFRWWLEDVRTRAEPGKYSVIVIDPVTDLEDGLVQIVRERPGDYGLTRNQIARSEALLWGAMKSAWKTILVDLASRCQTFCVTAHMREKFSGGRPTGKREAKGKSTLSELASLHLELHRDADKKTGKEPEIPTAKVVKHRLVISRFDPSTRKVEMKPVLAAAMPQATPDAIRQYIDNPPEFDKLKKGEKWVEIGPTEDDRLQLRHAIAEAERETESIRLDAEQIRQAQMAGRKLPEAKRPETEPKPEPEAKPEPAAEAEPPKPKPDRLPFEPDKPAEPKPLAQSQIDRFKNFKATLGLTKAELVKIASRSTGRLINSVMELNQDEAADALQRLYELECESIERAKEGTPTGN